MDETPISGLVESTYKVGGAYVALVRLSFSKPRNHKQAIIIEVPITEAHYLEYPQIDKEKRFVQVSGKLEFRLEDIPPF